MKYIKIIPGHDLEQFKKNIGMIKDDDENKLTIPSKVYELLNRDKYTSIIMEDIYQYYNKTKSKDIKNLIVGTLNYCDNILYNSLGTAVIAKFTLIKLLDFIKENEGSL